MSDRSPAALGDWLGAHARSQQIALVDASTGERVSYQAWNERVVRTAQYLARLGVRKGDRVAILGRRRVDVLDLWLACGKLGAVAQMLNVRLTASELRGMLSDAPSVVLYGDELEAVARQLDVRAVAIRTVLCGRVDEDGHGLIAARVAPEDPWVICYTGGSTGHPKGALLTHGGIRANAEMTCAAWELGHADRAILNAPLFHVGGLFVLTTPLLLAGGCSIVCDRFDAGETFSLIESERVTALFGVPTMHAALVRHSRFASADLLSLRFVVSGGAPCPDSVLDAMASRRIPFRQGYGLTEAGPNNFHVPHSELSRRRGAVGYPLPGVEAKVVDATGATLPSDAAGELCLRGPHLFAGYIGGVADNVKNGWLHTGDLAIADDSGAYTIVGRLKEVIFCGGENVYPAEIEGVLSSHAKVAEVCVIGVPDSRLGEVGRAVVVPQSDDEDLGADLLAFARKRLARFKVPKDVVLTEALPRTATGKVDRRAVTSEFG